MLDIASTNLSFLKSIEFDEITSRLSINEGKEGELVSNLTVTVNKDTGEILDIARSAKIFKGANILSSPIAIKRKSLFEPDFKLELINQGNASLPDNIRKIVEQTFSNFNDEL
jgi:hypothetical protein